MCSCKDEICGTKCPCMCHPVQSIYNYFYAAKETKK